MTKAGGSYRDFLSLVRKDGLDRTSKFEVHIVPPNSDRFQPASIIQLKDVSLLAEVAVLPEVNIKTERLDIYGPTHPRPVGIDYGDTITITFYLDRKLTIRDMFERWVHMAIDPLTYNVSYQNEYTSTEMTIRKLDKKDDVVREYKFEECFPISIGKTQLSYGTDEFSTIDVTFAYRRWTPVHLESSENWSSLSLFAPLKNLF